MISRFWYFWFPAKKVNLIICICNTCMEGKNRISEKQATWLPTLSNEILLALLASAGDYDDRWLILILTWRRWSERVFILLYWWWSQRQCHEDPSITFVTKWLWKKDNFVREIYATWWRALFFVSHSQTSIPWKPSSTTQFHFLLWMTPEFEAKLSLSFCWWDWMNILEENSIFRS